MTITPARKGIEKPANAGRSAGADESGPDGTRLPHVKPESKAAVVPAPAINTDKTAHRSDGNPGARYGYAVDVQPGDKYGIFLFDRRDNRIRAISNEYNRWLHSHKEATLEEKIEKAQKLFHDNYKDYDSRAIGLEALKDSANPKIRTALKWYQESGSKSEARKRLEQLWKDPEIRKEFARAFRKENAVDTHDPIGQSNLKNLNPGEWRCRHSATFVAALLTQAGLEAHVCGGTAKGAGHAWVVLPQENILLETTDPKDRGSKITAINGNILTARHGQYAIEDAAVPVALNSPPLMPRDLKGAELLRSGYVNRLERSNGIGSLLQRLRGLIGC